MTNTCEFQIFFAENFSAFTSHEPKKKVMKIKNKKFQGLACQIVIPLLCYIPIFSVYTYSQLNQKENIASEHLLMILTCFPALIDPFISLYFVVPYRNAILRVVTNRKEEEKSTMAVASTVSIRQVSANIMS